MAKVDLTLQVKRIRDAAIGGICWPFWIVLLVLLLLAVLIILGYLYSWDWLGVVEYEYDPDGTPTGVTGTKTIWDWMELLIIPIVLALGAWWLNTSERRNEREIAEDNRNQTTLEAYFDRMTELLLERTLRESQELDEVRCIARTRTLSVLRNLDSRRKGQVLQFLYESNLVSKNRVVDLTGADFDEAQLQDADLAGADLSGISLRNADLRKADLRGAILVEADLSKARLLDAYLNDADLGGANLEEAELSCARVEGSETSLYHANLQKAKLRKTRLCRATLARADLRSAILRGANLSEARLHGANLSNADLRGLNKADLAELRKAGLIGPHNTQSLLAPAKVTAEQLDTVGSLHNTIMPDGTKHE
jgi:uncharacterized protein YjbI with pentapeptide repeats